MSATPTTEAKASTKSGDESHVMTVQSCPSRCRELPTITIGGAMYSDTPSQLGADHQQPSAAWGRQDQPRTEPEQIKLKSAVFRFRQLPLCVNY